MPGNILEISRCSEYTPVVTLVGGAGNTVPQYTTNQGRCSQNGSTIFTDILLDGDGGDEGAGTGVLNISLSCVSSANIVNGDSWFPIGTLRNGTAEYILYGIIAASANTISLTYFDTINNVSSVTGALQNNSTRMIRLHFWYEIDI